MANHLVDDVENLKAWQTAMKEFNDSDKTVKSVKDWKERHVHNALFTYRQRDAIAARCENVLSGVWGESKKGVKMKES